MNISKNSWHFKLVKNTFRDSGKPVPSSLCPYMRAVLYRVIFFGGIITGVVFMLGNMLLEPMLAWGATGVWAYIASFFGSIVMLGAILAGACGLVFGGVWLWQRFDEWRDERKYEKRAAKLRKEAEDRANGIEPAQPNIVAAFVKAKHDQICPTLAFVDKEEK